MKTEAFDLCRRLDLRVSWSKLSSSTANHTCRSDWRNEALLFENWCSDTSTRGPSLRGQLTWPFLGFLLLRRCSNEWEHDRHYPSPLQPSIRLPIYGSCGLKWSLYRVKGICGNCETTMLYGFRRQKIIAFRLQSVACAGLVGSSISGTDNLGCLVQQWNLWMVAMIRTWMGSSLEGGRF